MPPVHVSPGLHLFALHTHPSDPATQSAGSTEPEAPAGISHIPDLQTPLAQSGPVEQVVFGNIPVGMQSPPVPLPLSHSIAWVQREPGVEPDLVPLPVVEPRAEVEPSSDVEPPEDV